MRLARLGNLLLAIGISGLILVGIEMAARHFEPEDERTRTLKDAALPVKSNDTFRIVALGSSNVYGAPIPEMGFVSQLQYWITRSEPSSKVEIINLGFPAATSTLILERARRATKQHVDLFLIHTGFAPFFFADEPILARDVLREATRQSALVRMMKRQAAFRAQFRAGTHEPNQYTPGSEEYNRRVTIWKENVEAILDVAHEAGAPVLLATNISNLADWPPFDPRRVDPAERLAWDARIAEVDALVATGDTEAATQLLDQIFENEPQDATLIFLQARVARARGDYALAREMYLRARDLDRVPLRPVSGANDWVRKLAAERDDVILVDLERLLEENSPHGLVGFNMMYDATHPTPVAASLIANEILKAMADHHFVIAPDADVFSVDNPLESFMVQIVHRNRGRGAEIAALVQSGVLCMKHPFYRLAEAEMYFTKAGAIDSSNWEPWAHLAHVSMLKGEIDRGVSLLNKAAKRHGGNAGIVDESRIIGLSKALVSANVSFDSATGAYRVR